MSDPPRVREVPFVPHESLKREQQEAVNILGHRWKSINNNDVVTPDMLGVGLLPTGFCAFLSQPFTRSTFWHEAHWKWNQSHRKVRTEIFGVSVLLQKFTPKRMAGCGELPVPSHKMWVITIDVQEDSYFIWVERGLDLAKPQSTTPLGRRRQADRGTKPPTLQRAREQSPAFSCSTPETPPRQVAFPPTFLSDSAIVRNTHVPVSGVLPTSEAKRSADGRMTYTWDMPSSAGDNAFAFDS